MKIKYNRELLETMNIFSRATGAAVKDCFEIEDVLYFVVEPGNLGKAIGKGGILVKELQSRLKKRIRVLEYSADITLFIKNVVYPARVNVEEKDGVVVIQSADRATKGQLIGRNAKHLNMVISVTKRYFPIHDIKVE
jgi:transcription termination/antitermination protein NusA